VCVVCSFSGTPCIQYNVYTQSYVKTGDVLCVVDLFLQYEDKLEWTYKLDRTSTL